MSKRIVMVNPGPRYRDSRPLLAEDPEDHLYMGRLRLIGPYDLGGHRHLGPPVMALKSVQSPNLKTLGVDSSWRLYYDPVEILYWPLFGLAGVIHHEVWHLLLQHFVRAQILGIDHTTKDRWNVAADMEIHSNKKIVEAIKTIPGFVPYEPERFGLPLNETAEFYYHNLPDDYDYSQGTPQGEGQGPGEEQEPGEGEGEGQYGRPGAKTGVSSSADGIPREHEMRPTDEVVSGAQERKFIQDTARRIKEAIGQSKEGIGNLEKNFADWILAPPKVDWKEKLRTAIKRAVDYQRGMMESTYARVSRRQHLVPDIRLTGYQEPTPDVAVILDSSGSMYTMINSPRTAEQRDEGRALDTLLHAALHQVGQILEELGTSIGVNLLVTTTAVQFAERVFEMDDIQLTDGGGTDMSVGFEAAERLDDPPSVVICLTDGYTGWPADRPAIDATFIIAIIGKTEEQLKKDRSLPDWADEIIAIDEV